MRCEGCGNTEAYKLRTVYHEDKTKTEYCDRCAKFDAGIPDVSVPSGGYHDEHLGCFIHSKRQKADLLKQKGWVECGSRVNPVLGRPMPYIKDPVKRKKFCMDNFGK